MKKLFCKVDLFSISGWCVRELVWDRRSVFQTGSNWAAVSVRWRWGTAGASDWELFCSQPPAVAPTVTNNHWCTTQPLSLLIFLPYFQLKALWNQCKRVWSGVAVWRGACAGAALIKDESRHASPPPLHWPFPRLLQEAYIADLDAKSGASLKLTLLNPRGRIWTMVAGGGASVVYRYSVTVPELTKLHNYKALIDRTPVAVYLLVAWIVPSL